jgi:hypothetical protein
LLSSTPSKFCTQFFLSPSHFPQQSPYGGIFFRQHSYRWVRSLTRGSEVVHNFLFSPPQIEIASSSRLPSTAPSLERFPSTTPPSSGSSPASEDLGRRGPHGRRISAVAVHSGGRLYAGELDVGVGAAGRGLPQASSTRGWARPGARRGRARRGRISDERHERGAGGAWPTTALRDRALRGQAGRDREQRGAGELDAGWRSWKRRGAGELDVGGSSAAQGIHHHPHQRPRYLLPRAEQRPTLQRTRPPATCRHRRGCISTRRRWACATGSSAIGCISTRVDLW